MTHPISTFGLQHNQGLHAKTQPLAIPRFLRLPMRLAGIAVLCFLVLWSVSAHAIFDDNEARRAILDLRNQINQLEQRLARTEAATQGQVGLAQQISDKDREIAKLRGDLELAQNNIRRLQEDSRTLYSSLEARIKQLEPKKVAIDGQELSIAQEQHNDYQIAMDALKSGNHAEAVKQLQTFLVKYPKSTLEPQARYFLGTAQFAQGDYKASLATQRDFLRDNPDHPRAADAMLSIAGSQLELKAIANAKKTLSDIVTKYPNSSAATSAKARLAALK